MKTTYKIVLLSILLFIHLPINTLAEKPHPSAIENLSPELRLLLKKEMNALHEAMNHVFFSYISGEYTRISEIAGKMKNSYILMQNLTESQKSELHHLPSSFLEMDQKFHDYAEMLEHVAHNKNTDSIGFYYSKLVDSCQSCHSLYAKHRFPILDKLKRATSHGH